ncbi:MAG: DUF6452 family protein [Bacteroidales bacterium]
MKILKIILMVVLLSGIFACSDNRCLLDTDTLLNVEMSISDPSTPEEFIDSLSVFSPEWSDSIFYKNKGYNNSIWLMLSPAKDTSTFIFTSNLVEGSDTLTFFYQRDFNLLSVECGFVTHYTIDSILYTQNYIDSLTLIHNSITTNDEGLVKIYF